MRQQQQRPQCCCVSPGLYNSQQAPHPHNALYLHSNHSVLMLHPAKIP